MSAGAATFSAVHALDGRAVFEWVGPAGSAEDAAMASANAFDAVTRVLSKGKVPLHAGFHEPRRTCAVTTLLEAGARRADEPTRWVVARTLADRKTVKGVDAQAHDKSTMEGLFHPLLVAAARASGIHHCNLEIAASSALGDAIGKSGGRDLHVQVTCLRTGPGGIRGERVSEPFHTGLLCGALAVKLFYPDAVADGQFTFQASMAYEPSATLRAAADLDAAKRDVEATRPVAAWYARHGLGQEATAMTAAIRRAGR